MIALQHQPSFNSSLQIYASKRAGISIEKGDGKVGDLERDQWVGRTPLRKNQLSTTGKSPPIKTQIIITIIVDNKSVKPDYLTRLHFIHIIYFNC